MKARSKDSTSRHSSVSTPGDDLEIRKSSSWRKVSIIEAPADETCEGIQNLRNLQRYVKKAETGVAKSPKTAQEAEAAPKMEIESSKTVLDKSDSKVALKRKPKEPPVNPFWKDSQRPDHPLLPVPRAPRTVEIRGGDILGQCECVKRNGLQHDCPKWDCRGEDLCLTWPMPTCQPSGLGVPIIVESRVKRPDSAHCELTAEEKKKAEIAAAIEKRKEEVRLVEQARADWKSGQEQAAIQKMANQKKGYLKCNIHSGKYRLVPLMRNETTQTPDELCTCPCDDQDDPPPTKRDKSQPQIPEPSNVQVTPAPQEVRKDKPNMESVRTSTTGIPTAKKLKTLIKT